MVSCGSGGADGQGNNGDSWTRDRGNAVASDAHISVEPCDRHLAARANPDTFRANGFHEWSVALRGIQGTHIFTPRGLATVRPVRERKVCDIIGYFRDHAGRSSSSGRPSIPACSTSCRAPSSPWTSPTWAQTPRELREHVDEIMTVFAQPNVSDYPFLHRLHLQGLRRSTKRRFDRIFSILDDIVERRASSNNKSKHHHEGGDTVVFTLEWVMANLLRNPPVMAKLRAELDDMLGGKDEASIEEHDTARLPNLQAVLKESMRLHSVGPLLHHFVAEDGVVVGGYAVPRGATTPLDFRGKETDFLPFWSGRSVCPGIPLAERVMPFILALMLHTFEWRLSDGMSPDELDVSEKFMSVNVL
uniref:Cytochrome P450 n=1 Tax=Oryza punctata TaxID=4537 RepID=A0A0E0JK65_ORYPU